MLWKDFVKENYSKVKHLPNLERLKKLSEMHKKAHKGDKPIGKVKKGGALRGGAMAGDIPELDAQGRAFTTEELIKPAKMPSQITQNIQPSASQIQKAQDLQAKNPWAPYKVPYDYAEGYPVFIFQHPNKWSANPNEVLLYSTLDRFMESDIYAKLKDKLKKIAGKYSGYSGGNRDGTILPFKKFRLIFRSKSPDDRSEYVYDAVDKDDYLRVLDMSKDSNFIIPVELASKAFMDSNAKQAVAQSQNARDVWKLGFQEANTQWKQNIQDASAQAEAQKNYFFAKKRDEEERSGDGVPSWLKTVGSIALEVAPLLL